MALLAVGSLLVELTAAVGEHPVVHLDQPLLPAGFSQPVDGETDADHQQQPHPPTEAGIELAALQILVGEVRLAIRRQFDLAAELGFGRPDVEDDVDDEPDEDDRQDDETDRSLG